MMSGLPIGAHFWIEQIPKSRVHGQFTVELGEMVQVTLEGGLPTGLVAGNAPAPLPAPRPGDLAGIMRAAAAASVARSRPITFCGQLDTGELVSVFDARDVAVSGPPHYVAPVAVLGANVTLDQPYNAVRFRLDHRYRLSHLHDNEPSVVEDDESTLSVEASEEGNWLVYTPSIPVKKVLTAPFRELPRTSVREPLGSPRGGRADRSVVADGSASGREPPRRMF
jgi:hypothetical protein